MQENFKRTRKHLKSAAERQKKYYDFRTKERQYNVGDWVLRFYAPNLRNKLKAPYIGPYRVMDKLGEVIYKVQRTPDSKPTVIHVDHLKPYQMFEIPQDWRGKLDISEPQSNEADEEMDLSNPEAELSSTEVPLRGSTRRRRLPAHLADYYMGDLL